MKSFLFPALLFFTLNNITAQSPDLAWVKQLGGSLREMPVAINLDASGNIYTSGYFKGTPDFDPGPGTYTLSASADVNAFVCKLDAQGNFLWAKQFGAPYNLTGYTSQALGQALCSNGDIYITGSFNGLIDFDPGPATTLLTSYSNEVFIAKLDAQGNYLWAKKAGGAIDDIGYAVAVDAFDAVYLTGFFMDSADFDPDFVNSYSLTAPASLPEAYVLKLDAAGTFVWARQMTTSGGAIGYDITVDNSGNVYSTGSFIGTTDFDPGIGTFTASSVGDQDVYVWKLDPAGNFLWAKTMGGTTKEGGVSIITNATGDVFFSGFYTGSGDYDPGAGTFSLTAVGLNDFFISRLDSQGNMIWTKTIGGSGNEVASSLELAANGDIYATGQFENNVDFDPGAGTYTLASTGYNTFISKYDASGNFTWVKQLVSAGYNGGSDIALDASGTSVYTTGSFSLVTDFDPNAGTYTLSTAGVEDMYIHKMSCANVATLSAGSSNTLICSGNTVTLTASGATSYTWSTNAVANAVVVSPNSTTSYTVTGTDANGCTAKTSITQVVNICTGIAPSDKETTVIHLFPNPATRLITVEANLANNEDATITIFNSLGQVFMQTAATGPHTEVSIEGLPVGIYFLALSGDKKTYEPLKFVKE